MNKSYLFVPYNTRQYLAVYAQIEKVFALIEFLTSEDQNRKMLYPNRRTKKKGFHPA